MPKQPLPSWAEPGKPQRSKTIDLDTAQDMPVFWLQRQDVWRKADTAAKAEMRERSIELLARSLDDREEKNMRELARRYPNMSPGVMQGLAQGMPQVMPNGDTAEPFSDQGDPIVHSFDAQFSADVQSAIADQTYGATSKNPVPQAQGVGSLSIIDAPVSGTGNYAQEEDEPFFVDVMRALKGAVNVQMNALGTSMEVSNAATETSAGNEQLMREQIKKYGLDENQAREVFGDRLPADFYTKLDPTRTAQTDPRAGAGAALFNLFNTNEQTEPSEDVGVPEADMSIPAAERLAAAKDEWRQHLVDTGQITEDGETSYRNITGRTTLALQAETGTLGQGGWFGGGVDEEVDKPLAGLAGRQSDIRPYAQREASKAVADAIRKQYTDAGMQLSLDDYTLMQSPRTWTEGRGVTAALDMSPGTVAERAVSGTIDFVWTLGSDPFSYTPPGLVKGGALRGANLVSKARPAVRAGERAAWFEADLMLRKAGKGTDLRTAEDAFGASGRPNAERIDNYLWDTDNGGWVLKDEQGAPIDQVRLSKERTYEQYYGGFVIERKTVQSRKKPLWEVRDKDGNILTFNTRKKAREHVEANGGEGRKTVETWRDSEGNVGKLGDLQTKAREKYLQDQGVNQSRVTTSRVAWDWLLNSVSGTTFTRAVAGMDNWSEIWLRSNRKIPVESAIRLAAAKTPEEVRAVMSSLIGTHVTDPKSLKAFHGVRASAFNGKIRLAEKKHVNRMFKALSFAPRVVPVDMTDMDEVAETAYRFGVAVGMKPSEIMPYLDELGTQRSNLSTFNTFHDQFVLHGVKNALRRSGVDDERINALIEKVRNARKGKVLKKPGDLRRERTRTGALEAVRELTEPVEHEGGGALLDTKVADGTFVKGLDDEVALFAHELTASHLVLPTPRELRREMNKVAQVLRKVDPGKDEQLVDLAFQKASSFLDGWRNLTLMNVSYIFRNIAEEIMTLSLLGAKSFMQNPFHAIATTMAIHGSMEYASGFRGLQRMLDRAAPLGRSLRAARYRPEKYAGARLVNKNALRSLITREQGDRALQQALNKEARTAKGRKVGMEDFVADVERGILEPIEVTVDYRNGTYGVSDGVKRLLAAFDVDSITEIPVRIVPGTVENGRALPFAQKTRVRFTGNQARPLSRTTTKQAHKDDWTHKDLFGTDVNESIPEMLTQMKDLTDRQMGMLRALKYVFPYFDANMALANGKSHFDAFERAVRTGDTRDVPKFLQFATRLFGSALLEEHPDKIASGRRIYDTSGQEIRTLFPKDRDGVPYPKDSQAFQEYVAHYADMLGELAADKRTREYLFGEKTLDALTKEIIDNPRLLQDVLGTLRQGVYDTGARAQRRGRDLDLLDDADIVRYHEENVYDTVRGVLEENLRSVGKYLGLGTAPQLKKIVAEGRFRGKVLNSNNKKLQRAIADELINNPSFRDAVPGLRKAELVSRGKLERVTTAFFSTAGNMRDMITLHPYMRQMYVEEVARLARYMTPEARQGMINDLRLAGDDPFVEKILNQDYAEQGGWLTQENVHDLADVATRKSAEKAFYNAAERRNWAVMLRWASPFAQAAVNSTYRWGMAMARDPISSYRTARSLNAINDGLGEWVGVYEPELEDQMGVKGYMDRNAYGDDVFVYPLVGRFASLFGMDKMAATFTSSSVNVFQTGIVTGIGPVAMFALGLTPFRDVQSRSDVLGDIFRFFQPFPMDQSGIGETVQRGGEAFIPSKWKGIVDVDDEQVTRLSQALLTARLANRTYGPMYDWTSEQARDIAIDLNNDARRILRFEGITKLFGPLLGSFTLSPMIHTSETAEAMPEGKKGKAVLDYMITAEYQAYVGNSSGDERQKRQTLFFNDYGPFLSAVALGKTTAGIENQPVYTGTGEVTNFAYEEPKLYRKYRNSIGYLFPEGDYGKQWSDFDRFMREKDKAEGVLKTRDTLNQIEYTRQYMMRWQLQRRLQQAVDQNPEDLDEVTRNIKKEFAENGLKGYDEDYRNFMLGQIRRAVADPDVKDKVKTASYVDQYFKIRDKVVQHIKDNSELAGSLDSDAAWTMDDAVRRLYRAGVQAANKDAGFANFWVSLADSEFGDKPEKYL